MTDHPEEAYRELAEVVVKTGEPIRGVDTLDNSLEAVFEQLPKGVFVIKMLNNPIAD